MGQIQVMSEALANQIAAGEVVERPASCVKELVENSLDAGAKSIIVQLEEGGIRRIRVQDDGHGMDEADLALAFARHATSKVKSSRDLFRIATLGFRGEALASIGAVARVTLQSRQATSEQGHSLRVQGSTSQDPIEAVGMPVGTIIDVEDLFFNTPARLKYLRTVQTEQARCVEVVQKAALSRPDVRMRVEVDGHVLFQTTGTGNPQNVLATLYGVGEAGQFLKVQGETADYQISGYIGRPTQARSTRQHANLFINQRPIRNIAVHQAVAGGYGQRLMVNKQPIYAIYIELDPGLVDVNIHPHKSEVRFSEERDLTLLITKIVRQALDDAFLVPTARFGSNAAGNGQDRPARPVQTALDGIIPKSPWRDSGSQQSRGGVVLPQGPATGGAASNGEPDSAGNVASTGAPTSNERAASWSSNVSSNGATTSTGTPSNGTWEPNESSASSSRPSSGFSTAPGTSASSGTFSRGAARPSSSGSRQDVRYPGGSRPITPEVLETVYGTPTPKTDLKQDSEGARADSSGTGHRESAASAESMAAASEVVRESGDRSDAAVAAFDPSRNPADMADELGNRSDTSAQNAANAAALTPAEAAPDHTPTRENWRLRPIGQTLGMYILADDGEDLYIIDQHAAHERVLYEKFTKQMADTASNTIELLAPMTFHLSPGDAAVLTQHLELLAEMGLTFEPFGGYSFLLRSIPTVWDGLDSAQLAQDLVSSLAEDARAANVKEALRERVIMRSCKAAIKANHRLSDLEMRALIEAFSDLDDPFHCPHGRPVFVRLTSRDLEKEFRRIV